MQNSKKGESTIIANVILFIAVMAMAGAAAVVFKNVIESSTSATLDEKTRTVGVVQTAFVISAATYSTGTVYVYAKNTGTKNFDPEDLDIYIDGIRVPRDVTNRTVTVTSDTDSLNTGIWDQKEEIEFNVFQTFSIPETHEVIVYTPNGVKAEGSFSS